MNSNRILCIIVCVIAIAAVPISAGTIADLFDTGVGSNGALLPNGTSPDPHYSIVPGSDGSIASTTTVDDSSFWFGGGTTSMWVVPSAGYNNYLPNGPFDYQTTFTLPVGASSVAISASLAADDLGEAVLLNGQSVGVPSYGGFGSYTPVSFTSGDVVAGTNTLTFITANFDPYGGNSPTGLRVDSIAGTYTVVPEPSCIGLIGFALVLFRRP